MQPPPGPAGIRQYCFSCGCPGSDTATMRLECLSSLIFISMDGYDDMCLFVWKCLRPPPPGCIIAGHLGGPTASHIVNNPDRQTSISDF